MSDILDTLAVGLDAIGGHLKAAREELRSPHLPPSIRLQTLREAVQERHVAPVPAGSLNDYAHDQGKRGNTAAGLVAMRRALAIAPDHPIILSGMGSLLYDAGLFDEARGCLMHGLLIEPEYAPLWGNLGSVLGSLGLFTEAKRAFEKALALEPDFVDARWNYAITMLDAGEWTPETWANYEVRKIRGGGKLFPTMPFPLWTGNEDLNGKTILVMGEQGAGDRILFSRYLGWLKERYPTCQILCMNESRELPDMGNFMWAYRDIVEMIPTGIPWPHADYGVSLMSLPGIHGTTPDNVYPDPGYLRKNAIRHKNSVALPVVDDTMLKVGICWTGNPIMKRNGDRSIPFEKLLCLAELPNVVLFGLQYGTEEIAKAGADQLVCDLTPDIAPLGFTGTAAIMLNLDLVITNCTSVAHVAGVLDVPCWTMLCTNPYWLWLRDRTDSVWYPNTKLYRQQTPNDWAPVLAKVKADLAELADGMQFSKRALTACIADTPSLNITL